MDSVKKTHGLCCPECGKDDRLHVSFKGQALLTPYGSEDSGDHEWDDDSEILCGHCDTHSALKFFRVDDEPRD
jgi:hypothetical protein